MLIDISWKQPPIDERNTQTPLKNIFYEKLNKIENTDINSTPVPINWCNVIPFEPNNLIKIDPNIKPTARVENKTEYYVSCLFWWTAK